MANYSLLQSFPVRFALGLWLGAALALYAAFMLQLEPAQWAGVTACITFLQTPRLNYSKILGWGAGTLAGATFAVFLISSSNQDKGPFLGGLTLWIALCAGAATLMRSYNAFAAVLAGFTAALISLTALDHPDHVFSLAMSRISCIFVGIGSSIIATKIFLPGQPHWRDTVRHFERLVHDIFSRAGDSLHGVADNPHSPSWAKLNDHLSQIEHSLAPVTAESADSRIRAFAARNLLARLLCLLAKSQSIEECLISQETLISTAVQHLLDQARSLLLSSRDNGGRLPSISSLEELLIKTQQLRESLALSSPDIFVLLRLEEILAELEAVETAWDSLQSPEREPAVSRLKIHRDWAMALLTVFRCAFAVGIAGIFWDLVGWPAGYEFMMYTAIACTVLSLQEDPRKLCWPFLQSALLCVAVAFFDQFWVLQKGEGFIVLAFAIGLFLLPSAYIYRRPELRGGAGPSALLFFGLLFPANQMSYDISVFLNNAIATVCGIGLGFFSFFAIMPPAPARRCDHLLGNIWRDLAELDHQSGRLSEQGWVSLSSDRIRLLHHFSDPQQRAHHDRKARLGLQLGLRRLRLQSLIQKADHSDLKSLLKPVTKAMRRIASSPEGVHQSVVQACRQLQAEPHDSLLARETLAELSETGRLLRSCIPTTEHYV